MGIPSFYRALCRRFPRLIGIGTGPSPEWLCLDFNCAMYGVLRQQPPVTADTCLRTWERDFCDAIAAYMTELALLVRPTKGVYVSCDGVVCAAKRRQQRLRRFKGPWFAAAEASVRRAAGAMTATATETARWNQNALTPGSAFMASLGPILTAAGRRLAARAGIEVIVSNTDEPGEGEHKLLAHMRSVRAATCTIYGLDADLILLAMLLQAETGADVRLLREAQEFESRSSSDEWRHLTIRGLTDCMIPAGGSIPDFVAAMSLLGNDFLPRSLTRTVRDDGIPKLLDTLERHVWSAGGRLVTPSGRLSRTAMLAIVGDWAATEEGDMLAAAQAAADSAQRPAGIADSPEETALREWQAQPARWASLTRILGRDASGRESLVRGWRDVYYGDWRAGDAAAYIQGLAWVWDYYSGRPVEQGWQFDEHLPPLWSDVAASLTVTTVDELSAPTVVHMTALPAWLHLLSVLPADSITELLPPEKQCLIARAPWYWPASWSLFDVGRTQMWECEPVLPTIPELVLRAWV